MADKNHEPSREDERSQNPPPSGEARKDEHTSRSHEEQLQFRGALGDVCSNAESNAAHPELCGTEEPIVDAEGRPLRPERYNRRMDEE